MSTTDQGTLLDSFEASIRELVPSATQSQDRRWKPVDDIDKVPSGEVRVFFVDGDSPTPVTDGVYSTVAIEHEFKLRVYTSYGNLRRREMQRLRDKDALQIFMLLDLRRSPIEPGLYSVTHDGWDEESDEQGARWGAHTYSVHFLHEATPT